MFTKWFRQSTLDPLTVSMAGVKLADRVLVVGCGDPRLIAALAAKAGLTGRACAVDESADRVEEAGRVALAEGSLIETFTAPFHALPFEPGSFDVVVVRDVITTHASGSQALLSEVQRVLRSGGRCLIVENTPAARGISAVFGARKTTEESAEAAALNAALKSVGFVAVRTLAERDGLIFVEGGNRTA
jgi:ubiquinone/menaquinone biosynthesis C-methylase UbiE